MLFLNSAVDAMDPLLEAWPVQVAWRSAARGRRKLLLSSDTPLAVNITPSAFRCGAGPPLAVQPSQGPAGDGRENHLLPPSGHAVWSQSFWPLI